MVKWEKRVGCPSVFMIDKNKRVIAKSDDLKLKPLKISYLPFIKLPYPVHQDHMD